MQNVPRDTAPGKCGLRSPAVKARYMDVEDVAWLLVAENDDINICRFSPMYFARL